MVNDTIADMISHIKNGLSVQSESVVMPSSRIKADIARILKEEGFIKGFDVSPEKGGKRNLKIFLKYGPAGKHVINKIKRVSKPSLRVYWAYHEIPRLLSGLGVSILSTSKGVITGKQARKIKVGGEALCVIS
jgi:small subunit ribosomal protein S8